MKKTFKNIISFIVIIALTFVLSACVGKKEKEVTSRVQIDVNPSVELLVDEKNVVVSVSGLNEEGKMIVAGEKIVGKDADEASKIVVDIMLQTGFIVKGSVSSDENEIKISVTSNTSELQASLNEKINSKINKFLTENDVKAKITEVQAYTKAQVEAMLLAMDQTITAAEANAMELNELYKEMAVIRLEQAKLYSQALVEMYNNAKAYEFKIAEKKETAKVIDGLESAYQTIKKSYSDLIASLDEANKALEQARYDNLVNPNCSYQQAYKKIKEAKIEIVKLQNEISTMPEGVEKTIKVTLLGTKETAYAALISGFDTFYTAANKAINALITTVNSIISQLEEIEKSLPTEIKSTLEAKATEIDKALNEVKTNFFTSFEKAHKDDIEKINSEVEAYKESLKTANVANNN